MKTSHFLALTAMMFLAQSVEKKTAEIANLIFIVAMVVAAIVESL